MPGQVLLTSPESQEPFHVQLMHPEQQGHCFRYLHFAEDSRMTRLASFSKLLVSNIVVFVTGMATRGGI